LNVGVNDEVVKALTNQTGNPTFALDVQRHFLQMFGTVVRKVPKEKYLDIMHQAKVNQKMNIGDLLSYDALVGVVTEFKKLTDVPDNPYDQLKLCLEAVFTSWASKRCITLSDCL
jgi:pyruvate, orthophosphate dikinase